MVILPFVILIVGHQLLLQFMRRRFDPFDISLLIDIVLLTMWVFAPLSDNELYHRFETDLGFQLTTFFGIVFLYAGLHLPVRMRQSPPRWLAVAPVLYMRWFWMALFVFVVATLAVVIQKLQSSGLSFWSYMAGERMSAYGVFLNDQNGGAIAQRLISFTHPIMLMWLVILLEKRLWRRAILLYLILLIGIVLIATTRLPIIITLIIPVFYYFRSRNRSVSILPAILSAVVFILLMFVLNVWRGQGLSGVGSIDISPSTVLGSLAQNFNPLRGYEMLWRLNSAGSLPYDYGLTYLNLPLTVVPRALWENKPMISFESRWTTYFFGQPFAMTAEGRGVWTFTVWGEGLAQFGVLGVFVNLFLYGLLISWTKSRFIKNPRFLLVWFYYSVLSAVYLRSSFSALLWTYLVTFLPVVFVYLLSTRRMTGFGNRERHTLGQTTEGKLNAF